MTIRITNALYVTNTVKYSLHCVMLSIHSASATASTTASPRVARLPARRLAALGVRGALSTDC